MSFPTIKSFDIFDLHINKGTFLVTDLNITFIKDDIMLISYNRVEKMEKDYSTSKETSHHVITTKDINIFFKQRHDIEIRKTI